MKRIAPIAAVLAVAVAAFFVWSRSRSADVSVIRLSGNLELKQYELSFKTAGRIQRILLEEGDRVRQGGLVAVLDTEQIRHSRDREAAVVRVAQLQQAQSATSVEYQQAAVQAELALRRAEVSLAEASLADLLAGSRPQEITQARAALAEASSALRQASVDWDRAQKLFAAEDISAQQFDAYRTRLDSASAALTQAQQRLALLEEGPRKDLVVAARAQLSRAQAAVHLAEVQQIAVRQRQQEYASRGADRDRAQSNLAVYEAQLEDAQLYAPVAGIVLQRAAEPGEVVAAGTSVITIGDLERPWLQGYIPETQLGRVKLGQKVRLTTDSFPGREYWGRVSYLASEAEFTPKQVQTAEERVKLVYRIKVDVANASGELKNNMPMDAEILTGEVSTNGTRP